MSPPPPASLVLSGPLAADLGLAMPIVLPGEEARLRRQAFAAVVVAAICVGFSPIFVKLSDVGPAAIGFWRLLFALGPTAVWAYAEYRALDRRRPAGAARVVPFTGRQLLLATFAGLFFAVDLLGFHAGLARTSTANGVLLGNLAPVCVMVMAWLFLGERPTKALLVALVLALVGSGAIIVESTRGGGNSASFLGDLMCVGAAGAYAAYLLVIRVIRRGEQGTRMAAPTAGLGGGMVSLLSTATAGVFCLAYAVGTGEQLVPASLQGFLAVAALGIVAHATGQGLATFALGRLPAGLISVVLLLQIIIGVSLAALMFAEIPSVTVLCGGALIIAGVMAVRPR